MDWHRYHANEFGKNVQKLAFEHRPARCFQIRIENAPGQLTSSDMKVEELDDEQSMQAWLSREEAALRQSCPSSVWKLIILAFQRGPANDSEIAEEAAADQLWNMGCSRKHFIQITEMFGVSKAFPHCVMSDESYYSRIGSLDNTGQDAYLEFNLRRNQLLLKDMALSSVSHLSNRRNVVLLFGCTERNFKTIHSWLDIMKDYGAHPTLVPALFLELYHRHLKRRYRALSTSFVRRYAGAFNTDMVAQMSGNTDYYRNEVSETNILSENVDALQAELVAFRLRMPDIVDTIDFVANNCPEEWMVYMTRYGELLRAHLKHLARESEHLQAKASIVKNSSSSLIASMWNIVTMNESQISQQISIASKRDSSIMMGITVGTLTFLPGTAIATIFAMPLFQWEAGPSQTVTTPRFWIYLAVTIPVTAFTLLMLFLWMSISDRASREKGTVRLVVQEQLSTWNRHLRNGIELRRRKPAKISPPDP